FFALPVLAQAKNFALVIGGKANPGTKHDVGRSLGPVAYGLSRLGYETTLLFGDGGPPPKGFGTESQRLNQDYAAINQLHAIDAPATKKTIVSAFDRLVQQTAAGDNVEIVVHAHGLCAPGGNGQCRGQFVIFDDKGQRYDMYNDELIAQVARLDAKGVQVNMVFAACKSGAIVPDVEKLKNACVFLSASEANQGYFCVDPSTYGGRLPDGATVKVASFDLLAFRYFKREMPRIRKIPYYRDDVCLSQTRIKAVGSNIDFTNLSTTFWGARASDQSDGSPFLSGETKFKWREGSSLAELLEPTDHLKPICVDDAMAGIDALTRQTGDLYSPLIQNLRSTMKSYITAFNTDQSTLEVLTKKLKTMPVTHPDYKATNELMYKVRTRYTKTFFEIIDTERTIVDATIGVRQRQPLGGNPNCKRTLE
ncbi:MAG TPA: hypothetical protein VM432_04360, partial [Bdellovibrionales bacterium]|nr:hypothetical protein [Bdellovibrionales bacterium]